MLFFNKKNTRGEDIYHAVNNFFIEHWLTWNKVSEVNVDGAPAMIGGVTGFRGLLIRDHPDIRVNHCLIHRHALTSKDISPAFDVVMKTTVSVENFIKAHDLNARLFRQLCDETADSDYNSLLFYNAVRWLSRGKTLQRVFILRDEIQQFLHTHYRLEEEFSDIHFQARFRGVCRKNRRGGSGEIVKRDMNSPFVSDKSVCRHFSFVFGL